MALKFNSEEAMDFLSESVEFSKDGKVVGVKNGSEIIPAKEGESLSVTQLGEKKTVIKRNGKK